MGFEVWTVGLEANMDGERGEVLAQGRFQCNIRDTKMQAEQNYGTAKGHHRRSPLKKSIAGVGVDLETAG